MLEFEETCPYCGHTCEYTLEDIGLSGFLTCKECGEKHLACSICTHSVDENGNCAGCSHDKTKWSLSEPDAQDVLEELIKSVDKIARNRIVCVHRAEDNAKKSVESCMEQIENYVHDYVRPYVSLLCMEKEYVSVVIITPSPMPNLQLSVHRDGHTDLCSSNIGVHEAVVRNWKAVKEKIHTDVQREVKNRLKDLKEREDNVKKVQQIVDTFEI